MSIMKIPLLIANIVSAYAAATSPQPPASATERPKDIGTYERLFSLTSKARSYAIRPLLCAASLLEIVVILARSRASHPLSQVALIALVRGPHSLADSIRVSPLFLFGSTLAVLGAYLRVQCYRALGPLFTFEVSIKPNHRLVTRGPYAYVRHPSYTSYLACVFGVGLCAVSRGSWARECNVLASLSGMIATGMYILLIGMVAIAFVGRMPLEDAILKKKFGRDWEEWAARVRYQLVPYLW